MALPLYKDCQPTQAAHSHAGLWFDKFFDKYNEDWKVPKDDSGKLAWIKTMTGKVGDKKVSAYARRQEALITELNGKSFSVKTDWHFATGLGNNHPVENGFAWHPTLGIPYLTGAAVKGLLRGWCEVWLGWKAKEDSRLLQWFGDETQAGELIFFDALPTGPVRLKADVMTPHMGDWYKEGDKPPKKEGSNIPADWHNPLPIPFLVVAPDEVFQFSVATRARANSNIVIDEVVEQLKLALEYLGAGAKTAVGYGRMRAEKELPKKHLFKVGEKATVTSVEDPKKKDRFWFQDANGFGGVVVRGKAPQIEIGEETTLWVTARVGNNYNFSTEAPRPPRKKIDKKKWK